MSVRIIVAGLITLLALAACEDGTNGPGPNPHVDSADLYRAAINDPAACQSCHPNHFAEWETSMHHYAFHDPVFFRLNEIGQERSDGELGQFCIGCHSPLAEILGEAPRGFDPDGVSSLAKAGVSCEVCHKMGAAERGRGIGSLRLDGVQQGSLPDPVPNTFHSSEFQARYSFSGICGPCHDVFTPDGFLIERTNTEWNQSPYGAMGLECQDCHMPHYSGQAAVNGPQRDNLHRHTFVGVDVPLTPFPGREETIEAVRELLQNSVSMVVEVPATAEPGEFLPLAVSVRNDLTGHNIPSGTIFERQMWVELIVSSPDGEDLYASGTLDPNGDLRNDKSTYVKNGEVPEDRDLTLFNGTAYTDGKETPFFWEADDLEINTIAPFATHTALYAPEIPQELSGELRIQVRLLFRAFPPYILRDIGLAHLLSELPVFEMERFEAVTMIQ